MVTERDTYERYKARRELNKEFTKHELISNPLINDIL